MAELTTDWDRKIEIVEQGSAGVIHYIEGDIDISFDYEFGTGNCIVYIFIPTEAEWKEVTGLPIEQRKKIIEFVAVSIQLQKVPKSNVFITDKFIYFNAL